MIISIARVILKLDKKGFTKKEALFSDIVWMAACLTWMVVMIWGER
jgi:hypothetical protein